MRQNEWSRSRNAHNESHIITEHPSLTAVKDDLITKIWNGSDPFEAAPLRPLDATGYSTSQHHYLTDAIEIIRPRIVIEVGVWKGVSVMVMSKRAQELDLDCAIIAVDTWLGSAEHWNWPAFRPSVARVHGYPVTYFTFLSNVKRYGQQDRVVPLPLDSVNACEVLKHHGVSADLIHIDAGHDYRSVKTDLDLWWPMLRPGGMLLGDDYYPGNPTWPGVVKAFDEFFGKGAVEHSEGKCRIRKPGDRNDRTRVASQASAQSTGS